MDQDWVPPRAKRNEYRAMRCRFSRALARSGCLDGNLQKCPPGRIVNCLPAQCFIRGMGLGEGEGMVDDMVVDGGPSKSKMHLFLEFECPFLHPRDRSRCLSASPRWFWASYTRLDNRPIFSPMRKSKIDKGRVSTVQHGSIRSVVETPNPNFACPHSSACFNVPVACRIESASVQAIRPCPDPPRRRPALGQTIARSAPSKSLPSGASERPCRGPDGRGKTTTMSKASFEGVNGHSFSDYKWDNPLSRHALFLSFLSLVFLCVFRSLVVVLFSPFFVPLSLFPSHFLSFLLTCQVGRHHQGRIKSP